MRNVGINKFQVGTIYQIEQIYKPPLTPHSPLWGARGGNPNLSPLSPP